jgi:general secretion pathway protein E/type IV pilus assembly protein PilB
MKNQANVLVNQSSGGDMVKSEVGGVDQSDNTGIANSNENIETVPENEIVEAIGIGELLVQKGVISPDQLVIATKQCKLHKGKVLGDVLIELGFITESTLGEAISKTSGIKKFDIRSVVLDSRLVRKLPKKVATRYKAIAVDIDSEKVSVAIHDVFDIVAIDAIKRYFPPNLRIDPLYCPETDILEAIDQYYDYEMSMDGILREIENSGNDKKELNPNEMSAEGYKNPTVRLVDSILIDAVHSGASDIHFEPEESFLRLRYRIDGQMMQIKSFHKEYWPSIAVRIKIMSSMNIAENRKPQDGHASANILGREVDFRVATQPTVHGENIVMRVLDKAKSLVPLDQLGYSEHNIAVLKKLLRKPEGIIIVTGPTGSGKTTTLYSVLSYISSVDKNIMTLEDPVEYEIPLIRQTNVREGSIDFVSGIKSLLRQDPDVIFVGEVRDEETASIAVRAAMTGHQVFTTLHTSDAIGAIARMVDIGIKPYLLSGSLVCSVAQRLGRKLCDECKKQYTASTEECGILKVDPSKPPLIYRHIGCDQCNNTGYKGRIAIAEILAIDKELDEMIALSKTRNEIEAHALSGGFVPMIDDAADKVLKGVTDIDEIAKTIDITDRL